MSQQQAILFLASWYPTPQNPTHGIFIKNHAIALSKKLPVIVVYAYSSDKHSGFTITKNKTDNLEEWLLEYKKVPNIPFLSIFIKLLRFKKAYRLLLNELISNRFLIKAIQVNTIFPAAIALPLFKKHFRVLHTVVEHWSGYLPEDGNYNNFFQKKITQKTVNTAAKIFYVSEKQKQAMLAHNLKGNYELLYNVVNTSVFKENKSLKSKRPLLLHVSSLVEKEKNITGTLCVMRQLQNANFQFDLLVVGGDETHVSYYKKMAQELGLVNTTFAGEKKQEEVASYMQSAHALILFSNYEGMPVVVLEAFASGLPVFASNVGHLPHLITDDLGRIISVNDQQALENNLKEFLDGKLTFDAQKMIAFVSKNASQEVVGKKLADFYNAACSSTNLVNSTN